MSRPERRIQERNLPMPRTRRRIAIAAAAVGNGIFGFSFMFSRMALAVASPFTMLMYRFVTAFLVLGLIALWAKRTGQTGWFRFSLRAGQAAPLCLLGLFQPVCYFLCESYGISLTNATFSGVIIALVPIAALGAGVLALGEKPSLSQVGFALLSIAGVVLMTLQQSAQGEVQPLGVVLLLGAVASGVLFNLCSRKLSAQFSALERTVVMMLIGAVTFTALALWENRGRWQQLVAPLGSPAFLWALLYLSCLSSVVAFLLLNYANTELPVAQTSVFCNLTTVISLLAGVLFLGEPFGLVSLLASVVIVVGVWGVQRRPKA
ncbi:MAG: DMT family transporter [Clostridiales bacterium]|nr:DMT family transporter [Clostridiales bacterium]